MIDLRVFYPKPVIRFLLVSSVSVGLGTPKNCTATLFDSISAGIKPHEF